MTESMIERVARAICDDMWGPGTFDGSTQSAFEKDCFRSHARAAISALREHKVVVRINGEAVHEISGEPNDLWQMFLDEGLSPSAT